MVFTGYTFERLRASSLPCVNRFLRFIDLLVSGPYMEHLQSDGSLWRASTNQTVHVLTDRLKGARQQASADGPVVELTLDGTRMASTGFPTNEDCLWLDDVLAHVGR